MKVQVFTREDGRKVYAVTGMTFTGTKGSLDMAKAEVARYKKESYESSKAYKAQQGFIRKYTEDLLGVYTEGGGTPCVMVWKK